MTEKEQAIELKLKKARALYPKIVMMFSMTGFLKRSSFDFLI